MPRLTFNNALINYYESIEFGTRDELLAIPEVRREVESLPPEAEEIARFEQEVAAMGPQQFGSLRFVPVKPWGIRQATEFVQLVQGDLGAPLGYALYAQRRGPDGVTSTLIGFLSEFIMWLPLVNANAPETGAGRS